LAASVTVAVPMPVFVAPRGGEDVDDTAIAHAMTMVLTTTASPARRLCGRRPAGMACVFLCKWSRRSEASHSKARTRSRFLLSFSPSPLVFGVCLVE
jgi:hypothetical protein